MKFISENWLIISVILIVLVLLVYAVFRGVRKDDDDGLSISFDDSTPPDGGVDPDFIVTPLSEETKLYECGHNGPLRFQFTLFGVESQPIEDAEPCPACAKAELLKICARCARCGKAIMPSDEVAIYHHSNSGLNLEIATYVDDLNVIGCMDKDCCPSGGFFAGFWTADGFKSAFATGKTAIDQTPDEELPIAMVIGK